MSTDDQQQFLSHLAAGLIKETGGDLPIETLHLRAGDYLDLDGDTVTQLVEDGGSNGIYTLDRDSDGGQRITSVTPEGDCPTELAAHVDALTASADSIDFTVLDGVGESVEQNLIDAGYTTFGELHRADPEDLTDIPTLTGSKAQLIVQQAGQHVQVETKIAEDALTRYRERLGDDTSGSATVYSITDVDQDVGDPLAVVDSSMPVEEATFHGLPILEDNDHPHIVRKRDMHTRAGEVIVPKTTTMEDVQLHTLEATAMKLARGNRGLRLVGPHGAGKNYLLKYLHFKTNRVLVSVDADASMLAQDLLGISTVNEDRIVVFRDGILTKAMKHGYTIVINEVNAAPAGVMMALQKVLNQNVLTVKESGEEVIPHPAARIVVTMNPPTREYRGSEPMNAATRDRFQTIFFDYMEPQDEIDFLDQKYNTGRQRIDRDSLRRMVEFANATRDNETWPTLSTRKLEDAIDWYDMGASVRGALKHVVKASTEPHQNPDDTFEKLEDT